MVSCVGVGGFDFRGSWMGVRGSLVYGSVLVSTWGYGILVVQPMVSSSLVLGKCRAHQPTNLVAKGGIVQSRSNNMDFEPG
jgi:hypothetical protein